VSGRISDALSAGRTTWNARPRNLASLALARALLLVPVMHPRTEATVTAEKRIHDTTLLEDLTRNVQVIAEANAVHTKRLDQVDVKLGSLEERFDQLEIRVAVIDTRVVALDAKVDALDAKLSSRIDALDTKVDALDAKLSSRIDALDAKVDALGIELARIATHLGVGGPPPAALGL
jgi:predicted  nucleic acid-binding Zn-ribbon protein